MNADPNEVINDLAQQIARLVVENTALRAALKKAEQERTDGQDQLEA